MCVKTNEKQFNKTYRFTGMNDQYFLRDNAPVHKREGDTVM